MEALFSHSIDHSVVEARDHSTIKNILRQYCEDYDIEANKFKE